MTVRELLGVAALAAAATGALGAPPARAGGTDEVQAQREVLDKHAKEPFEQKTRESALAALGKIGGPEAAEVVCSVLSDPFVHLRDHAVSALIAMLEGARAAETAAWLEKKPLADRAHPEIRRGVATALGVAGGREAGRPLAAALAGENDAETLLAILEALERIGDPSAVAAARPLLGSKDDGVVGAAARTMGRCGAAGTLVDPAIRALLAHCKPLVCAGAIDGLAAAAPVELAVDSLGIVDFPAIVPRIALADAIPALAAALTTSSMVLTLLDLLLADVSWRVRVAAVDACLALWTKEAIAVLLPRLRKESGRLRGDVHRALRAMTGKDMGPDPDPWEGWWKTDAARFEMPPKPAKGARDRGGGGAGQPTPGSGETKTVAFFRLPILSQRLAFVFDLSGSMKDPIEKGDAETKVALLRREFETTAAALPKECLFDAFVYRYPTAFPPAPRWTRALGALSPGGEANAKKANAWLAKEEPKGWGAIYDALVLASAEDVDTIVLLSDGVPSRGTYDRGFRLVDEFRKANRFRRVAVDTVLVGKDASDRRFLEDLAAATDGRFQDATAK